MDCVVEGSGVSALAATRVRAAGWLSTIGGVAVAALVEAARVPEARRLPVSSRQIW